MKKNQYIKFLEIKEEFHNEKLTSERRSNSAVDYDSESLSELIQSVLSETASDAILQQHREMMLSLSRLSEEQSATH